MLILKIANNYEVYWNCKIKNYSELLQNGENMSFFHIFQVQNILNLIQQNINLILQMCGIKNMPSI